MQIGHFSWSGVDQRELRSEKGEEKDEARFAKFVAITVSMVFTQSEMGSHKVLSEEVTCSDF